jgi:hypothetical protein
MTEGNIKHYIIAIVIFTIIMVGGIISFASFGTYSRATEFNKTFNKMADVQSSVGGLQDQITGGEADAGAFGFLNALIGGAWNALKTIFTSFDFMSAVLFGANSFFGVPTYIISLILLIISTIIIFAIYSAIFQREP